MYEEKIRQLMDWDFGCEDFRAMFSNELALALKDIRAEYDGLLEANRSADTESWCGCFVQLDDCQKMFLCITSTVLTYCLSNFRSVRPSVCNIYVLTNSFWFIRPKLRL